MSEYICKECKTELVEVSVERYAEIGIKYVTYRCPECGRVISNNQEEMTDKEIKISKKVMKWVENDIKEEKERDEDLHEKVIYDVELLEDTEETKDDLKSQVETYAEYFITKEQILELLEGKLVVMNNGESINVLKISK